MASSQGKGESKTSPRMLTAREREDKAFALRRSGYTYQEIADEPDMYATREGARKAVDRAMRRLPPLPELESARKVELAILDDLLRSMRLKVEAQDPEACRVVVRVLERRAKLLGSDALPSLNKVGVDTVQGVLDALVGLAVRMLAADQRPAFMAQVETTLLQITDGQEKT